MPIMLPLAVILLTVLPLTVLVLAPTPKLDVNMVTAFDPHTQLFSVLLVHTLAGAVTFPSETRTARTVVAPVSVTFEKLLPLNVSIPVLDEMPNEL